MLQQASSSLEEATANHVGSELILVKGHEQGAVVNALILQLAPTLQGLQLVVQHGRDVMTKLIPHLMF